MFVQSNSRQCWLNKHREKATMANVHYALIAETKVRELVKHMTGNCGEKTVIVLKYRKGSSLCCSRAEIPGASHAGALHVQMPDEGEGASDKMVFSSVFSPMICQPDKVMHAGIKG